ncbi:hypothetical protein GJAV_G00215900 [Gymnothorax javanicus]|nr:hypothetical protein GJAV_G00215900 [Gymnothorax javanicus]
MSVMIEKCFLARTEAKSEQKPATMSDTIDSLDLEKMEEKMGTMSTESITIGPTAPGSRDPIGLRDKRSVQSNSSEQLMSHQLQLDWALNEESALKQPCSLPPEDSSGSAPSTPVSFEMISESPKSIVAPEAHSPGGIDIGNTELDSSNSELDISNSELDSSNSELDISNSELDSSNSELDISNSELDSSNSELDISNSELDSSNNGLDGEQSELTAALDRSEVLSPQAERRLLPLQQSLSAQPPAAAVRNVSNTETRAALVQYDTWTNVTSDVLVDFDALEPELEESFMPLNSDDRNRTLMKGC